MVNQPSSQSAGRAGRLWRWFLYFCAGFVLLIAFLLIYNNVSFVRSQSKLQARMDAARESVTNWIYTHPEAVVSNPSLMFMIYDMERMSGDPRLQTVLEDYDHWLVRTPSKALNPVWRRFVHPDISVPEIDDSQLHTEGEEPRWDAFAVAPDRVQLDDSDHADMFSPTKYVWGARQHQLLALAMYRDFNGGSPELDATINYLAQKIARDAHYDFRVSDSYVQRTTFILAAGRPDLIRRRWVERILDNQKPDGRWDYCWYGWCRGVVEFNAPPYPAHTTVQAAWTLYMLNYRYPDWIRKHSR